MQLTLRQQITQFAHLLQSALFPILEAQLGKLDKSAKRLVAVLEMIPMGRFIPSSHGWMGRPSKDRYAIACAFVAKAVYGFSTTRQLLEALQRDAQLRRICGWEAARRGAHGTTLSPGFWEIAPMEVPPFVHEGRVSRTQSHRLIGPIRPGLTA